jgi:hypothetical protein
MSRLSVLAGLLMLTVMGMMQRTVAATAQAAKEPTAAHALFIKCDRDGDRNLSPAERVGFILALNSALYEEYDATCDGILDDSDLTPYYAAKKAQLEKDVKETIASVQRRTSDTINEVQARPTLDETSAFRIVPDASYKDGKLSAGFGYEDLPAQFTRSYSLEATIARHPVKSFRTRIPTQFAIDWSVSASRDLARGDTEETETDELAFKPLSFTFSDGAERIGFAISLGTAYVWSEKLDRTTGVEERDDGLTIAYAAELTFKPSKDACFGFGLAYELRQRQFFSGKVSSKVEPGVEYDLLCFLRQRGRG